VPTRNASSIAWLLALGSASCAGRPLERASPKVQTQTERAVPIADAPPIPTPPRSEQPQDGGSDAGAFAGDAGTDVAGACPSDMVHIRFEHCPKLLRRCIDKEYDKPNHITICNRFATDKPDCPVPRVPLDFCIDRYEYPNRLGTKPPVMLNFFEASQLCSALHKRLCYEREWVTACEGPGEKPFPYGFSRSSQLCNFDNRWVDPHLSQLYSSHPEAQRAELERLDRSLPSGARAGCVSDYGVYDLTGNVDEWTLADHDRPGEHARFSALKGGAWGHVRNACRPVTTSHAPEFRYYFIGLRCCSEALVHSSD
jgi:formylglycine-generating enzyme